MTEEILPDV